jgi:ABC-type transport system involved in multi-copper enzyme maturation permease subunit
VPGPSLDGNPVLWREWHRRRPSRALRLVWLFYVLIAMFFTVFGVQQTLGGSPRGPLTAWVNGLQVAFGLLLLTVTAVTALTEERARGTLDVLLTTPLPTATIVWGKWWGTYRTVLGLALLPLLLVVPLVEEPRGWVGVMLLLTVILVCGALVTSLGLALATWVRRPGLALALGVVVYVLVTVGWVFLVLVLWRMSAWTEGMASASPFWAAAGATALSDRPGMLPPFWDYVCWIVFWLGIHLVTTLALLALTLRTFNRCVGRVSGQGSPGGGSW